MRLVEAMSPPASRPTVVLATANPHKARELLELAGGRIVLLPRPGRLGEVEETGETFEENATIKAEAVARFTGRTALGEDSGLEVEALGGAPGVHSARYAGPHATDAENVTRLLTELRAVGASTPESRRARFRAVMVLMAPTGERIVAEGTVEGHICDAPRGEGGFGYDPVFVPDEGDGRTFAEMSAAEKNAISHRARAFEKLLETMGRRSGS
ncbi:MAG: hypothetical protein KatS3mg008_2054 [Acidimicrobiales bacterium]|nr:MAG: hypothetical protein KatS3mg008_2054 [Acidimicrobiales bacterium]